MSIGRREVSRFSGFQFLLILRLWPKPEVGEAFDLADPNQLLIFGPVEGSAEPLAPEFSLLLGASLRRRAA